ncbi:MAG: acetylornithine/succinylornithine family transaminase [Ruminococcaceae bacterium]|nr:acetylornithine/succinylornithine family transaminase [Oscillospiraceae bacterium]
MNEIQAKDKQYVAGTYARFPVTIDHGHGSEVFDTDGNRYIDMGSGIGVTALGIADEGWVAAVTAQLSAVQHMSNLYYTAPCADLAERLCTRTGMDKVFFSNSGAEANECAVKIARKYAAESGRHTILTLENSFHGRTLTTLAATGQEHFHTLFQPLTPGFVHTPANDIAALRAAVEEYAPAAVLFECVQGEGGVLPLEEDFVAELARLAAARDMLLMVDEVQTGNGRTGALYAYMHYGITPDVVTTAKGLGGGLPIGATLMSRKVSAVLGAGDHGSTYGGNPVAAAGACHVLDRLDDTLLAAVREKAAHAVARLTGARGIKAVTGKGLMLGIETEKPAAEVVRACMERGMLCLTAKTKVRLLPALTIPQELLDEALDVLLGVCAG